MPKPAPRPAVLLLLAVTLGAMPAARASEPVPRPGNVTLPVERFEELLDAARKKPPDPPPPDPAPPVDVTLDSAVANVTVKQAHADVRLDLVIQVLASEWVTVPLLPADVGLMQVRVNGADATTSTADEKHVLHLRGRGVRQVTLDLKVPVETLVGGNRLRFPVPRAVATSLAATLPGTGWDVHVLPATGFEATMTGGVTSVSAALARTDSVQLLWGRRRPEVQSFTRAAYVLEVVGEGVFASVTYDLEVHADEPREVPLLPARYALREVLVDGEPGQVRLSASQEHAVMVQGHGTRRIKVDFALNVDRAGGQPAIELDVPSVPIAGFHLILPGKREVTVDPPMPARVEGDDTATNVFVHFPATTHVRFAWTDSRPVPEQNIRLNGEGWFAVTAEQGGLRVAAHFAFDVISGKAREIGFVVPESVVIYQVTGDGVTDWRTFVDEESGQRRLQVYLDQPRHGAYSLDLAYDSLLKDGDARDVVPVPLLEPAPVHRYQGVVLLLAGGELEFAPVETSGYSTVGEESVPQELRSRLPAKVAHGFKHVGPAPPLTVRLVAPVREPARFDVSATTLITVDEGALRGQASADVTIKAGTVRELVFRLDPGVTVLDVVGPALLKFTDEDVGGTRRVTATFTEELTGTVRVGLRFERILDPASSRVPLAPITVQGADIQRGFIAVESPAAIEVEGLPGEGIHAIGIEELPRALTTATANPILLAYKYSHVPYALTVGITRHDSITPRDAIIASAEVTTVLELQGNLLTTTRYVVSNQSRQFLRVELPEGAELRNVLVAGRGVRPALDEAGLLIVPLPRADQPIPVVLVHAEGRDPFGFAGSTRLQAPRPDLPVDALAWTIQLPPGQSWHRLRTNVGRPPERIGDEPFVLNRRLLAPTDDAPSFSAGYLRRTGRRGLDASAALAGLLLGLMVLRARRGPSPVERALTFGLAVAGLLLVVWLGASPWALLLPVLASVLVGYALATRAPAPAT